MGFFFFFQKLYSSKKWPWAFDFMQKTEAKLNKTRIKNPSSYYHSSYFTIHANSDLMRTFCSFGVYFLNTEWSSWILSTCIELFWLHSLRLFDLTPMQSGKYCTHTDQTSQWGGVWVWWGDIWQHTHFYCDLALASVKQTTQFLKTHRRINMLLNSATQPVNC